jgi:hypothetical protein
MMNRLSPDVSLCTPLRYCESRDAVLEYTTSSSIQIACVVFGKGPDEYQTFFAVVDFTRAYGGNHPVVITGPLRDGFKGLKVVVIGDNTDSGCV